MFWTDWSLEPFIAKMGMDGSRLQKLITKGLFWPNGLTIDYATDTLWWVDAHLDHMEYVCSYDLPVWVLFSMFCFTKSMLKCLEKKSSKV